MSRLQGPILYDSLDKPNQAPVTIQAPKEHRTPARVIIAGLAFIFGLVVLLLSFVVYFLYSQFYYGGGTVLWTLALCSVGFLVTAMALGLVFFFVVIVKQAIIRLEDGVPLSIFTALFPRYDFDTLAKKMYEVQRTYGEHSDYRGVQTLTLDKSSDVSTTTVRSEEPVAPPVVAPTAQEPKNILDALAARGHINRSNNSFFIGYAVD